MVLEQLINRKGTRNLEKEQKNDGNGALFNMTLSNCGGFTVAAVAVSLWYCGAVTSLLQKRTRKISRKCRKTKKMPDSFIESCLTVAVSLWYCGPVARISPIKPGKKF